MHRTIGLFLLLALCLAAQAEAVPVLFVGHWTLKPNTVGNAKWVRAIPEEVDNEGNVIPGVPAHFEDPSLTNVIQVLIRRGGANTESYDIADFVVEVLPSNGNPGPMISSLSTVAPSGVLHTGHDGTIATNSPAGLFFATAANPGSNETLAGILPSSHAFMVPSTNSGTVFVTGTSKTFGRIGFNTNGVSPGTYTVKLAQMANAPTSTDFFNSITTGATPIFPTGADPNDPTFATSTGALIYGTVTIIPEPSTVVLTGLALIGLALFARRRHPAA